MVPEINYLAVVAGALSNIIIGFLWYGPIFGKPWARMMGFTEDRMKEMQSKGMGTSYALMSLSALVMSYILAHFVAFATDFTQTFGVAGGLSVGFWSWLGFVAPVTLGTVLWENKPWKLWMINAGYYLAALLVMGVILVLWK